MLTLVYIYYNFIKWKSGSMRRRLCVNTKNVFTAYELHLLFEYMCLLSYMPICCSASCDSIVITYFDLPMQDLRYQTVGDILMYSKTYSIQKLNIFMRKSQKKYKDCYPIRDHIIFDTSCILLISNFVTTILVHYNSCT